MVLALWICAMIGSLGAWLLLFIFFAGKRGYGADERMADAFFMTLGVLLLGIAIVMFIILTAIKAWS